MPNSPLDSCARFEFLLAREIPSFYIIGHVKLESSFCMQGPIQNLAKGFSIVISPTSDSF